MCAIMADQELTAEDVAGRLRVSRMTVMRRIKAGKIRARYEGGYWRILESDLQKYIASTYNQPGEK
jgi:excisionase family DNA binding protein